MNMIQLFFVMQFIIFFGIMLAQLYNVFNVGKWYTFQIAIILFIIQNVCYFVGVIAFLNGYQIMMISQLIRFEAWIYYIQWILFLAQILLYIANPFVPVSTQYNPRKE